MTSPPDSAAQAAFVQGFGLHQAGRSAEAAQSYRAALAADSGHVDALHLLGLITAQAGDPVEAEKLIGRALALNAASPLIWSNYGNVLDLIGRGTDAIAAYDRALALAPDHVDAIVNRGRVLLAAGRAAEALEAFVRAGELTPGRPLIGTARGDALMALGRADEALALYEAVLAVAPGHIDALVNRGAALIELDRDDDALAAYDEALRLAPGVVPARVGRAHALVRLGRPHDALAAIRQVIAVAPRNARAHYIEGQAHLAFMDVQTALGCFTSAMALEPDFNEAVYHAADALRALGRNDEAMPLYERVLARIPDHTHAMTGLATAAMQCCDWATVARLAPVLEARVASAAGSGETLRGLMPFSFLCLSSQPHLQLASARLYANNACPVPAVQLPAVRAVAKPRLKLGYLSSDIRRHAMAFQMAELIELHDRGRFEVIGFSGGPDDGSAIRQRLERGFDRFHDVARLGNREVAELMRGEGIDIAIDLNGHTIHSRLAALAWRPAPVQATYLGFPGTTGTSYIDYVIADEIVAPLADAPYFTERIVHLPDCYQVSDRQRRYAHLSPMRADYGLPQEAFVFCCFNSSYKISAGIFAVWMRILARVPGSVLWLVRGNDTMTENLRGAAAGHGIAPERLVFCDVVETDVHLARHALADLYLDTLPYNSHGTGSFALWGGLPMLTCLGPTFPGRVCASLLRAIGLEELVTRSLADYETMAVTLAGAPQQLAGLRQRLAANRTSASLFDTDRFRRRIEAAYQTMWAIACRGEAPSAFAIAPTT